MTRWKPRSAEVRAGFSNGDILRPVGVHRYLSVIVRGLAAAFAARCEGQRVSARGSVRERDIRRRHANRALGAHRLARGALLGAWSQAVGLPRRRAPVSGRNWCGALAASWQRRQRDFDCANRLGRRALYLGPGKEGGIGGLPSARLRDRQRASALRRPPTSDGRRTPALASGETTEGDAAVACERRADDRWTYTEDMPSGRPCPQLPHLTPPSCTEETVMSNERSASQVSRAASFLGALDLPRFRGRSWIWASGG